jgi:hypothetical protein
MKMGGFSFGRNPAGSAVRAPSHFGRETHLISGVSTHEYMNPVQDTSHNRSVKSIAPFSMLTKFGVDSK